jgi:amino acid transporter
VWWHVIGCTLFVILLPLVAPVRQTAQFVFTTFAPDTTYSGMDSYALLFMLSLLGSQWAMVGYDAAAHMAEETEAADFSGGCWGWDAVVAAAC